VKNITVTVADEVYRAARVRAAEQGSSVSALVRGFLGSLADRDEEFARLAAQQQAVQRRINRFRAGDRLSRDELHERAAR
jgi:plasmid stability protein